MDGNNFDDNENTKMWTPRIETKLINMLRDEVRNNQITGRITSWTIRHWNHYANQLHNIYGFRYTGVKVRQKYQRLKADYQTFKRLQGQTGLGWDPIIGTVVAPDEFWDKASRNVKKFRTKEYEYFQEIAEIVENCCATGALSRASTEGPLDSEEEDDMLNKFWNADTGGSNAGGSNAVEAIPVDLFGDKYMDPAKGKSHKRGPATSQTDSGRSKKSRSIALLELGDIPPLQYVRALTLFKDKKWRRQRHMSSDRENNTMELSSEEDEILDDFMDFFMIALMHDHINGSNRFQHATETICRHIKIVMRALCKLSSLVIKPRNLEDIPGKILNDRRFFPWFKDCVDAIDGTLVDAWVPASRQNTFRGRKATVSQNVLAACDFDMLFTFVNFGWEGSAHDNAILVDSITRADLQFPHPPNAMDPFFMEADNEMAAESEAEADGLVGDQADYVDMSQHGLTSQLNVRDVIATAMWQNHVHHA
ncbi:uncharacterized protein LOC114293138 [Camellia sinensis]|uniref:uncharacterized protein LOC114293138 n=1 Tax=Camellia sinensis TaxID=4442 RepID=UPI001035923D|nr:uncharacterized protein LOC114293138 [Camellia sinensis]